MTVSLSDRVVEHLAAIGDLAPLAEWRYEYREEIGRGGMGVVYRAWDRELTRDVAVKVLHTLSHQGMAARLLGEARIVAGLEHPGIVPVYDVGYTSAGLVACVMRLVDGERLDARIARGVTAADALRIVARICETMAFAHARGVIHRDLKPENIMLGAFGEVLVLDWGTARVGRATEGAAVLGTPGYMAPEQASGRADAADARTDVFGLGGILAALFPEDRPGPLAAIIECARAPAAADRYASALDLAEDIQRFASGQPVAVYRERVLERLARLGQRNREAILLVLVYLVLRMLLLLAGLG